MSRLYLRLNGLALPDAARSPLLERLLARAGMLSAGANWREQAFRLVASGGVPMPGVAAAALCGEIGPIDAGAVFLASPVHCEAGMVSVRLPADGMVSLDTAEAGQLAREFNRDFADGAQRLVATPSGRLFCVFAAATTASTFDPLAVCGRDIGRFLPAGPDGPRLRRLMSEIEMWLHGHALNRARDANGGVPITGLWLWGGGEALANLPALDGWTAGDDPLFGAWPAQAGIPAQRGSGVVVLPDAPGSAAWTATESAWLAPALAALSEGRIGQLELSIGEQRLGLGRRWSWRIWRRARPWWEYLA
ncbi:MAG: hypothetical protein ACHQIL_13655 [Steroidobacterales bacterium]